MKKTITTAILSAISAVAFASEPSVAKTLSDLSLNAKASRVETVSAKPGFTYFRFAAADANPASSIQIAPGLGIGYRLMAGNGAFDMSANYSSNKGWKGDSKNYFWTLPKASYVHYLSPADNQSAYAGVGLAWGGVASKDDCTFTGIIPSVTLGMEFLRTSSFRAFAELNVSQPAVAYVVSEIFPGPIAELSVGAGF